MESNEQKKKYFDVMGDEIEYNSLDLESFIDGELASLEEYIDIALDGEGRLNIAARLLVQAQNHIARGLKLIKKEVGEIEIDVKSTGSVCTEDELLGVTLTPVRAGSA